MALTVRGRVAIAAGEPDQAERDAHDALTCAAGIKAYLLIPDILECLAALAGEDGSQPSAHADSKSFSPNASRSAATAAWQLASQSLNRTAPLRSRMACAAPKSRVASR